MKYGIYKLEVGNLVHHFAARLDNKDVQRETPVAYARTKAEAINKAIELGTAL